MDLLKEYGIKVPQCHVANAPDEASHIFRSVLNNRKYMSVWVCVCVKVRQTTHVCQVGVLIEYDFERYLACSRYDLEFDV